MAKPFVESLMRLKGGGASEGAKVVPLFMTPSGAI